MVVEPKLKYWREYDAWRNTRLPGELIELASAGLFGSFSDRIRRPPRTAGRGRRLDEALRLTVGVAAPEREAVEGGLRDREREVPRPVLALVLDDVGGRHLVALRVVHLGRARAIFRTQRGDAGRDRRRRDPARPSVDAGVGRLGRRQVRVEVDGALRSRL